MTCFKLNPNILRLIAEERARQQLKWNKPHLWGWGDCSSTSVPAEIKSMVLTEECGEVARAVLELKRDDLKSELTHVAAVAIAWLESFEEKYV